MKRSKKEWTLTIPLRRLNRGVRSTSSHVIARWVRQPEDHVVVRYLQESVPALEEKGYQFDPVFEAALSRTRGKKVVKSYGYVVGYT